MLKTCRGCLRAIGFLSEIVLVSSSVWSDNSSTAWRVAWQAFWRDKFESLSYLNSEAIDRNSLACFFDEDVFRTDVLCLRTFTI